MRYWQAAKEKSLSLGVYPKSHCPTHAGSETSFRASYRKI
jgi:hypothetical protein